MHSPRGQLRDPSGEFVSSVISPSAFFTVYKIVETVFSASTNVLTFFLPNRGMLRRSRCALIFLQTHEEVRMSRCVQNFL